ncbi:MAG TPA: zeta toxin [Rikenellaceae bacterium]|nr:zeta toxin [Rikenellaceae bacterium]HBH21411.1 zeta toxin [Rikenellaceae bacterium]HCZ22288.1 zeta toxin [Rikenellaceae bacterium]
MPKLYIISGCNGSGKTTASYTLLPDLLGYREFVNSDEFAKSLSPFDPSAASITASRYMLMKINYLLGRFEDFSIETTLATRSLVKIIEEAHSLGYEVTILYFWLTSPELAIQRVKDRVASGGHNIPDNVVRRRYVMGLQYFFDTYIPICDRWILADNSKSPFTVVAEGTGNLTYIKDNEKFKQIRRIVHPNED